MLACPLRTWRDSHLLNNALAGFVIEGYGYPVEEVVGTTQVLKETLPEGDVDLHMEGLEVKLAPL